VVDALALLLDVEADVLENDDGALGGVGAGSLDLGADAVGEEGDGLAHELTELQEDRTSSSARTAVRRTRAHTTLLQYTVPGQGLDRTSIHFCGSSGGYRNVLAPSSRRRHGRSSHPAAHDRPRESENHLVSDGLQGELGLDAAVGTAEVGHEDDSLGAVLESELNGGDGAVDTLVVGDDALLVLRGAHKSYSQPRSCPS
jgi:hypothetical protein